MGQLSNPPYNFGRLVDRLPDLLTRSGGQASACPSSPRLPQRHLTSDEIDDLLVSYGSGDTVPAIATRLGVSRQTVSGHLSRNGVVTRGYVGKLTDGNVMLAVELRSQGRTLVEIGARLGVHPSTIGARLASRRRP